MASKNSDEITASSKSQRLEEGYYRTIEDNLALYEAIKTRYQRYISREFLAQCRHEFDTNLNEGMNQSVATYASKGLTFCTTPSLRARVLTAAGIQLVGYHRFWTSIFSRSNLPIKKQFSEALIEEDKRKVRKYYREHSNDYKAKRNKAFHDRFRNEIKAQQEDKNEMRFTFRVPVAKATVTTTSAETKGTAAVGRRATSQWRVGIASITKRKEQN